MLNYLVDRRGRNFDLFDDFFPEFPRKAMPMMRTNIKESESAYLLDVELPGLNKDEVKISLDDGYLTIDAVKNENKEETNDKYIRREIYTSKQCRSFYVGNVDESKIDAAFENGILKISVPKEELPQEETKKYIEIK